MKRALKSFWAAFTDLFSEYDTAVKEEFSSTPAPRRASMNVDTSSANSTITVANGSMIGGIKLHGWAIEATARENEVVTIRVGKDKLVEQRVRTNPDGTLTETVREFERPKNGRWKAEEN